MTGVVVDLDTSPKLRIGVTADEARELIDAFEWRAQLASRKGRDLESRTYLSIAEELRDELEFLEVKPGAEPYWRELLSYVYASALILSCTAAAVCSAVGAVVIIKAIVQAWQR